MNKYKSSTMMAMKLAKFSVAAALTAGMVFSTSSYVLAQEVTKLRMTAVAGQPTDGLQAALKI